MTNIYITWHYTTHGIAYLKHILSAFYTGKVKLSAAEIKVHDIGQDEMNSVFENRQNGFTFDKVYYLTSPQKSFDDIASRRFYYRRNILEDSEIINNGLVEIWSDLLDQNFQLHDDCIFREMAFVEEKYPDKYELFLKLIWRDMQHYSIDNQIHWFQNLSNAKQLYADKLEIVDLNVDDLRNETTIVRNVLNWIKALKDKYLDANFVINISLGSNETQTAWRILAENNTLSVNTRFIKTYDKKNEPEELRFKRFSIVETPSKIFTELKPMFEIFEKPKSESRKLIEKKMKTYINQGFSILLLGERGIGKTRLVEKNKGKSVFEEANCAYFEDDGKAESELFGHKKGAFTGAIADYDGLFKKANGGILFLDEVHHLSRRVQAKLMKAIQTDNDNYFTIKALNANKDERVKCTVIFASNKSVEYLRKLLLPDFYDRISQLIIELPPLRLTPQDREADWEGVWKQMRFNEKYKTPNEPELIQWLKIQSLEGNFRDLQKIAIFYKVFLEFDKETRQLIGIQSPVEFAKREFEKYHSASGEIQIFDSKKSTAEMISEYQRDLAEWAINQHGSAEKAVKYFNHLGDKITSRTLYKWKNGK